MNQIFDGPKQSLEDVLYSREERQRRQQELLEVYGQTLLSFKLNIPGPVKNSPLLRRVFHEGIKEFRNRTNELNTIILMEKIYYENSGPEYFAVMEAEAGKIKSLSVAIEEEHPLGRLFDFDLWDQKGTQLARRDMGLSPRRCFICNEEAFICSRNRTHTLEEILAQIESIVLNYFSN